LTDLLATATGRGVTTTLDADGLREPLPAPVARLLYRSAQEGLRNALAHAQPSTVRLHASNDGTHARIEVVDDGAGFDPAVLSTRTSDGHFGLAGLRDLVAHSGGTMEVRSAVGEGTTMVVEVPLR
jgi:signal transduction histidine kinase